MVTRNSLLECTFPTYGSFPVDESWEFELIVKIESIDDVVGVFPGNCIPSKYLLEMTLSSQYDTLGLDNPPSLLTLRYNNDDGYFTKTKSLKADGSHYISLYYKYKNTRLASEKRYARGAFLITSCTFTGQEFIIEAQDQKNIGMSSEESWSISQGASLSSLATEVRNTRKIMKIYASGSSPLNTYSGDTDALSLVAYASNFTGYMLVQKEDTLYFLADSNLDTLTVPSGKMFTYPEEALIDAYNVIEVAYTGGSVSEDLRTYAFEEERKVSIDNPFITTQSEAQIVLDRMKARVGVKGWRVEIVLDSPPIYAGMKCVIPSRGAIDGTGTLPLSYTGVITDIEEVYDGMLTATITITQNSSQVESFPCTWDDAYYKPYTWDDATSYTWKTIDIE